MVPDNFEESYVGEPDTRSSQCLFRALTLAAGRLGRTTREAKTAQPMVSTRNSNGSHQGARGLRARFTPS